MKILLKINGKTGSYSSKTVEWLIQKINTLWKTVELNSAGSCIVNYGKGYTNEFDFNNYDDFINKFSPCVEKELTKWMDIK